MTDTAISVWTVVTILFSVQNISIRILKLRSHHRPTAAVAAKCDLCDSESDNIVITPGEQTLHYCNKHYQEVYEKGQRSNTITGKKGRKQQQ